MKTTQLFFTGLFVLGTLFTQGQTQTSSLTSFGLQAGTGGTGNAFFGYQAGMNTTGNQNVFIGHLLTNNANVNQSVNIGNSSNIGTGGISIGYNNSTTGGGIVIGKHSNTSSGSISIGQQIENQGTSNIMIGNSVGYDLTGINNNHNIFIGSGVASDRFSSNNNIFIGNGTGSLSQGNNCIFIGHNSANEIVGDNLLHIENSNSPTPLIWGDFATDLLKFNGKVGVGYGFGNFPATAGTVNVSNYNLFVNGGILTEEVRVMLKAQWADYVFEENYNLPKLEEVEEFIKENKHLPNVPSAKEVTENGIELGETAKFQQEKIEELTLYIIEQNKINKQQQEEINELKEQVKLLLEKRR